MFENYKHCLFNDKIIIQLRRGFRGVHHDVYTKEINKIALSCNDYKRLQTFDKSTTNPDRTNVFKVCESEMMIVNNLFVKNYADCLFYDEIILQQRFKSVYRTSQLRKSVMIRDYIISTQNKCNQNKI